MKTEKIERLPGSVVWGLTKVSLGITNEQAAELRKALETVQRYQKAAIQAYKHEYKHDPKESDWCEFAYAVKNDRVIVSIRDGMAG